MASEFVSSAQTQSGYFGYVSEKTGQFKYKKLEYAIVNGRAVFEGDIILGTAGAIGAAADIGARNLAAGMSSDAIPAEIAPGMVLRSCVIVGAQYRWPNLTIPYTYDSSLATPSRVDDAIEHWHDNAPMHFVQRTTETDYVTFFSNSGLWSSLGRQRNQQWICLEAGYSVGNAIHEIGHTVGLWHEQSRADRDSYVTIHWDNIIDSSEHNFNQHVADGDDVGSYDYGSIMHYPTWAFSNGGGDTITVPAGVTVGQRDGLSYGDTMGVIYMYGYGGYYVGNRNTRELHMPGCHWVTLMSAKNRKYFWTIEDPPKTADYNGCHYCNRYWDTG